MTKNSAKILNDFLNDQRPKYAPFVQLERWLERFSKNGLNRLFLKEKRLNDFLNDDPSQRVIVRSRIFLGGSPTIFLNGEDQK